MPEDNAFSRDGDEITIRLDIDDYDRLLMMMGFAIGAAFNKADAAFAYRFLDLTNRINEGNTAFRPYAIPEHGQITPEVIAGAVEFLEETIQRLHTLAPKLSEGEQTT